MAQTESEMAAQKRKERIEKYFNKTPDPADKRFAVVLLCGAGLAFLLSLISFAGDAGFLGVLLLAAAGYAARRGYRGYSDYEKKFLEAEPKPSDEEMDRLLASDLARIEIRAKQHLGVTDDQLEIVAERWDPIANLERGNPLIDRNVRRPMVVFGPLRPSRGAPGRDKVWRFSVYEVMVICPTGYHLAIYRCELNFLTGGLRREETQEYHYSDVVAVSTTTTPGADLSLEQTSANDDPELKFAKTVLRQFQVVVSSSDRSKIVVGIMDEDQPDRQAELQESGIDQVITSVRRMLREKKGGAVTSPELKD